MNPKEDWDVEKHKQEHECDEHWELRRRFLLAHKDKFPEDELVCLAQVFTNVELLGCRYPKDTMDLIAELSNEVAAEYREKQKTKLQRTFVKASDAASSKAKGHRPSDHVQISNKPEPNTSNLPEPEQDNDDDDEDYEQPCKKIKLNNKESNILPPFGSLVLFDYPDDAPQSILSRAVTARGGNLDFKFDKNNTGLSKCIIFVNSKRLSEGSGQNQKLAKKEAATSGLHELMKYYYTIKVKKSLNPGKESVTSTEMRGSEGKSSTKLAEDNIGQKLMKLMGWSGGGLGKTQQGIVEPVTVKQQLSRSGLGLNPETSNLKALKRKSHEILRDFTRGDMKTDLVFSSDFTNEERAVIHQVAKQIGLKSQSYGPKAQRTLVISRKIDPKELVGELQAVGGSTDKYELISPTESQWC